MKILKLGAMEARNWPFYLMSFTKVLAMKEETLVQKIQRQDAYNIDRWYDLLNTFTFPTSFIPLTPIEGKELKAAYEKNVLKKDTNVQGDILSTLKKRIDHGIQNFGNSDGVFVRLSARSPKDAAFGQTKMKSILKKKIDKLESSTLSEKEIQNMEFRAFFEAQMEGMKIDSAEEAMELLTHSERVYEDLNISLEMQSSLGWKQSVAIRTWIDHDLIYEFRGFVFQRKLTALSQYFDMIFDPTLVSQRSEIIRILQSFFAQIEPMLPFSDCVVDFVLIGESRNQPMILEVNPFDKFTSAALFDWKTDLDLFKGLRPFEMRFLNAPLPVLRQSTQRHEGLGNLLPGTSLDPSLEMEFADLVSLVREHYEDDFERINSNLRYVLNQKKSIDISILQTHNAT
jgi:hypothetical protein